MQEPGARLLARAQELGSARTDVDGADLFALAGALAWLSDQSTSAERTVHLFDVLTDAVFVGR